MDDADRQGFAGLELEALEMHLHPADLTELIEVKARIEALASRDFAPGPAGPRADLLDLGDAWQLRLEVPGVDQSRLELALQGDDLVVAGIRETIEDGARPLSIERPSGPFQRSFRLPGPVDAEHLAANLRGGLLVVHLPKRR